jgi:hypothetical protein
VLWLARDLDSWVCTLSAHLKKRRRKFRNSGAICATRFMSTAIPSVRSAHLAFRPLCHTALLAASIGNVDEMRGVLEPAGSRKVVDVVGKRRSIVGTQGKTKAGMIVSKP